jgi:hypothetical protein
MYLRKINFLILPGILNVITTFSAIGQDTGGFDGFLRAGVEEAEQLMGSYFEPAVLGFSYGMSNGWYNTAETHRPLGFDITISANIARVPAAQEYFNFKPGDYENVSIQGDFDKIPTILGPNEPLLLNYTFYDANSGATLNGSQEISGLGLKDEIGYNVVPSPMVQIGIGTFKNTDLMIRYMPNLSFGDFSTCAFGFGIKHDIKQWIPVVRRMPFNLSIMAAFSGLDNRWDLTDLNVPGENQEALFDINNWTVQALVSKKISVLTLYGGFGYSSVSSCLALNGTYRIEDGQRPDISVTYKNPLNITYEEGSFRATAGMRLKFGIFTLHSDYTFQKYQIFSAGLGFTFK